MNIDPKDPEIWRVIGGPLGAFLSFLFWWPTGWVELLRRAGVAIVCAWVFGPSVAEYFGWSNTPNHALAGSVLCGLFAWLVIGVIERILKTANKLPKP